MLLEVAPRVASALAESHRWLRSKLLDLDPLSLGEGIMGRPGLEFVQLFSVTLAEVSLLQEVREDLSVSGSVNALHVVRRLVARVAGKWCCDVRRYRG